MRNVLSSLIFILVISGCDDFYETTRTLSTDKTEYNIGDEIKITATIFPHQKDKKIRLYENYKNLEISFALINDSTNVYNGSWTPKSSEFLEDVNSNEITITQSKPFIKTFTGKIQAVENKIEISIPELNYKVYFIKDEINKNTMVRIHGFCNPINPEFGASLEEYFEVKDIKIINTI